MVVKSPVPISSSLYRSLESAYFHDCYSIEIPNENRSPLELYLYMFSKTPGWIDFLMKSRNSFVKLLGLKDLGKLSGVSEKTPASQYRIGDRAGIFKLLEMGETEVVLGETDRHLDVKLSLLKLSSEGKVTVFVSTVVHVHNVLGRIYMFFIKPAHKVIAPATVVKLATTQ